MFENFLFDTHLIATLTEESKAHSAKHTLPNVPDPITH